MPFNECSFSHALISKREVTEREWKRGIMENAA